MTKSKPNETWEAVKAVLEQGIKDIDNLPTADMMNLTSLANMGTDKIRELWKDAPPEVKPFLVNSLLFAFLMNWAESYLLAKNPPKSPKKGKK